MGETMDYFFYRFNTYPAVRVPNGDVLHRRCVVCLVLSRNLQLPLLPISRRRGGEDRRRAHPRLHASNTAVPVSSLLAHPLPSPRRRLHYRRPRAPFRASLFPQIRSFVAVICVVDVFDSPSSDLSICPSSFLNRQFPCARTSSHTPTALTSADFFVIFSVKINSILHQQSQYREGGSVSPRSMMFQIRHAWFERQHYLYYRLPCAVSSYFRDIFSGAGESIFGIGTSVHQSSTRGKLNLLPVGSLKQSDDETSWRLAVHSALEKSMDYEVVADNEVSVSSRNVLQMTYKKRSLHFPYFLNARCRSYCSQGGNGSEEEGGSSEGAGNGSEQGDGCSKDDDNVSGEESDTEQPFNIVVGDWNLLDQKIQSELVTMECKVRNFKTKYNKAVRAKLSSSCLIAPYDRKHPSTEFLYRQTFKIMNRYSLFLSSYDIMCYESGIKNDQEWDSFIRHIIEKRIYIIEDWDSCFSTVETLMYDHGIVEPRDDNKHNFYKGECDASFNAESNSARLSFIIWKGDKIIHSEVYRGVSCNSATKAEGFAAFALLSKAEELKIEKLFVWSDCKPVCKVLSGELSIPMDHEHRNLYLMLRSMKRYFTKLIVVWKPRELMIFADDLAKASDTSIASNDFPTKAYHRWSEHLKGSILFRIERTSETIKRIAKFENVELDDSYGEKQGHIFFVEVEDDLKLECLLHLKQAVKPNRLDVSFNNFAGKSEGFKVAFEQLIDGLSMKTGAGSGQYNTFTDNACTFTFLHNKLMF